MTNLQSSTPETMIDTIVVIPTLNEADHIEAVIRALRADEAAARRSEIWVVDGASTDGTQEIVRRLGASDRGLRLIHNPHKTQGSAVNLAAAEARRRSGVRYLIRADAHAGYPAGWIMRLIATAAEEGADSVVVPMRTRGGGPMRDASADLFNSWLGNGGSPHRSARRRGFVEHGHHALFRLEAFVEAGGYDVRFLANEDAELDVRLAKMGRRIFLESEAMIGYVPRDSLSGIFRQFFRNGRYRLRTSLKHRAPLGARQLAPIGLCLVLIASLAAGALIHPILFAPIALYALAVLASAGLVASKKTPQRIALIAVIAAAAHLAFGLGALATLVDCLRRRTLPVAATPHMRTEP